jgi:hypothetical protein
MDFAWVVLAEIRGVFLVLKQELASVEAVSAPRVNVPVEATDTGPTSIGAAGRRRRAN